jgi:hypothetical protein
MSGPVDDWVVESDVSEATEPDQPQCWDRRNCHCSEEKSAAARCCGRAESVEAAAASKRNAKCDDERECNEVDHGASFKMAKSWAASAGSSA